MWRIIKQENRSAIFPLPYKNHTECGSTRGVSEEYMDYDTENRRIQNI